MDATLQLRQVVRPWLQDVTARIGIGVSGGADSLALAIALVAECKKEKIETFGIIIDHQLQDGSDAVALATQTTLNKIGVTKSIIRKVWVELEDGMEASARRARYQAFSDVIEEFDLDNLFLAHTQNDQAEGVLLGLARGSGSKSLSAMASVNGKFIRPLLAITREQTVAVCEENKIEYWKDPQNDDLSFARVKVRRQILPLMEEMIGPGIVAALARSAKMLREDNLALEGYAREFLSKLESPKRDSGELDAWELDIAELGRLPLAVRSRVLREAIFRAGTTPGALTAEHLSAVEALITNWHGQGAVSLPDGVKVSRISGRLSLLHQK